MLASILFLLLVWFIGGFLGAFIMYKCDPSYYTDDDYRSMIFLGLITLAISSIVFGHESAKWVVRKVFKR